jgi:hypothetical protein
VLKKPIYTHTDTGGVSFAPHYYIGIYERKRPQNSGLRTVSSFFAISGIIYGCMVFLGMAGFFAGLRV